MTGVKYIAALSRLDGEKLIRQFEKLTDGIRWSLAADLRPGERIDIYFKGELIYTNAGPPES
jgi:hypothetical protein